KGQTRIQIAKWQIQFEAFGRASAIDNLHFEIWIRVCDLRFAICILHCCPPPLWIGHNQRIREATRVPISRKRITDTRSPLNTKPRLSSSTSKPSLLAASRSGGGNMLEMRNSNLA